MSYASTLPFDLSPVRLSYVGALRGLKPHSTEAEMTFAQTGSFDPDTLICLAASNPNGTFFGLIPDAAQAEKAQQGATLRKIANVTFVCTPDRIPADLDYLCCEETATQPSPAQRDALFTLAQTKLRAGGLFAFRYKAYDNPDQILQFLVGEYAPELSDAQAIEFLDEIKDLGTTYFAEHPIASAALDKAIQGKTPASFFEACRTTAQAPLSGTFATMEGLLPRAFSFVGEADIRANYIELVAPIASHKVLDQARDHLLYEPLKDFALQRLIRNDVWVKTPVEQTFDNAELYNQFTFGITMPRDNVPTKVATHSGDINLNSMLFKRLIDLMTTLPMGVGDFLHHPAGHGMNPDEVVSAINVLIACGIAQPMRSRYEGEDPSNVARPVWTTSFNEFIDLAEISEPTVRLASPIAGGPLTLGARDALVLQAVNRVGLAHCAGSLRPELERLLQKNPLLASQITDSTEATDEVVHNIIASVVTNSLARWFAYGLLAA